MPGIASSAPAVLIAHLAARRADPRRLGRRDAARTTAARDRRAVRDARGLHPGRIDLGIGRAPGTDRDHRAGVAARPRRDGRGPAAQLAELRAFFAGAYPRITAVPGAGQPARDLAPRLERFQRQARGELGLPFSFAHHFMPRNTLPALEIYRRSFRPSGKLAEPYAMVGVAVLCAESDEQARWLHGSARLSFLASARAGQAPPLTRGGGCVRVHARPAGVRRERALVPRRRLARDGARRAARAAACNGADELMLTTNVYDHLDRLRSYELVSEALAGSVPRAA